MENNIQLDYEDNYDGELNRLNEPINHLGSKLEIALIFDIVRAGSYLVGRIAIFSENYILKCFDILENIWLFSIFLAIKKNYHTPILFSNL